MSFFIISLIICYFLSKPTAVRKRMSLFANSFSSRAFPQKSSLEFNKFALLRIFFGLFIFIRGVNVFSLLHSSEQFSILGLWAFAELTAGALIMIGLFSQWAIIFLVTTMWHMGDYALSKSTLGNDIAAMMAVLLFLSNAGKYISLDARIIRVGTRARQLLLYYDGAPSRDTLFYAKLSTLAAYWAVCVYSVSMHLNEPSWMDGSAGPLLLSNNFMSRWHEIFSSIFSQSSFSVLLAKISLWLMMAWYITVLPFVLLGGWFRKYVIIWGWLFFALSLFILQLSWLAEFEILFWLGLFWSISGMEQQKQLEVLYDDRCNLCDRTIQFITRIDIFGIVALRPLSQNKPLLNEIGITEQQALSDLYGIQGDERITFAGYDFYVVLTKRLALLWPLYPFLLLGKALWIGPAVYKYIAARRIEMFGVCQLPSKKTDRQRDLKVTNSNLAQVIALHSGLLIILYLLAVPAPFLGWEGIRNSGASAAHIYGITPIDVFNKTDLRMAENWFTIESVDFNELVPIFADNGTRLEMNKSDRIYFGHTVLYRRNVIGIEECHFDSYKQTMEYLSNVYLEQKNAPEKTYRFIYKQYKQLLPPSFGLMKNQYQLQNVQNVCQILFSVKPTT